MSQLTVTYDGLYPAHREPALRLKDRDPDALAEATRTTVRLLDGPTGILLSAEKFLAMLTQMAARNATLRQQP